MTFAFIVLILVLLSGYGVLAANYDEFPGPRLSRHKTKTAVGLSHGGKMVMAYFRNLPADSQPYTEDELESTLRALDVKYERGKVNAHFFHWDFYVKEYDNQYCGCGRNRCDQFPEYVGLMVAVVKIYRSIKQREHDLAVAGVAPDLDRVTEMTMRLHQEADIVEQVTKELL